jgi:hypothetical protein
MTDNNKTFTQTQLQAIADALGHTDEGLTGTEIGHLLATARIDDVDPTLTKRHHPRTSTDLANDPFEWIVRADLSPVRARVSDPKRTLVANVPA